MSAEEMMHSFDIAVIGSGFSGSLLAMAARRLGLRVILIERAQHPRFAIGESTTPLTNLLLEEFAREFDLPEVACLSKWSTWQARHPEVSCGLKRGFTFYHHRPGALFHDDHSRQSQLLVAASPNERVADTHWYRPDLDHFLWRQAESLGAVCWQNASIECLERRADSWELGIHHEGSTRPLRAKLLVDASGPRGFLFQRLGLKEERFPTLPDTCSLFAHFRNVRRTVDLTEFQSTEVPPYAPDDAAVHHVFDGGWIWVLRFNNGLTSAGAALTPEGAKGIDLSKGAQSWTRILESLPSVRRQFEGSQAVTPFVHQPRMPFLCSPMSGPGWILLPSAAGFVDPLFSSGFPLVLLGLHRLMRTLRTQWNTPTLDAGLEACASETRADALRAARLVGGIYQTLSDPEKLFSLARLYFAAVILTETARKLGRPELCGSGFLLREKTTFSEAMDLCLDKAGSGTAEEVSRRVAEAVAPIDLARLCAPERRNWIPVDFDDLRKAADKVQASPAEIENLIRGCR